MGCRICLGKPVKTKGESKVINRLLTSVRNLYMVFSLLCSVVITKNTKKFRATQDILYFCMLDNMNSINFKNNIELWLRKLF